MKKLLEGAKDTLRNTQLYIPLLWWRGRAQEQRYAQIACHAASVTPDVFAPPGWNVRTRQMLSTRWSRSRPPLQSLNQARVLIVDGTQMSPWWLQNEVQRAMDAVVFSLHRHKRGYTQGVSDLVSFSTQDLRQGWAPSLASADLDAYHSRLQEDLLACARSAHTERPLDLCIIYAPNGTVSPETLAGIRQLGAAVCSWWLDEKHAFDIHAGNMEGCGAIAQGVHLHLTNSLEAVRWYVARGEPAYYFPQAVDPTGVTAVPRDKDIAVSFVGAAYAWRMDFVRRLRRLGIAVACFGKGWENGQVEDALDVYSRSVINLGIGDTGLSRRLTCLKGRDFAVLGSGAFYLTTYDVELARLFDIGREVCCYRNEYDCAELIRYYLERPEEAASIGAAARARCLAEHTWTHRFIALLRWLGILQEQS